jgi:DNA-binding LytR/AlgR family response regulator
MSIKALIADDEAAARSRLRKLLVSHTDIHIEAEASDGVATLEAIGAHKPDILFLDIHMPGLTGFDVVHALPADRCPLIIFVTAFDEYALRAFDANALAYLLKPVAAPRLDAAVQRVRQILQAPASIASEQVRLRAAAQLDRQPLRHVLAIQRDRYRIIALSEVCFFRVEEGITRVKTATESLRTNYAIGDLETRLPAPPFFRAHRSIIANMDMVATVAPMFKGSVVLTMKDEQRSEIHVSERQAPLVREMLQL